MVIIYKAYTSEPADKLQSLTTVGTFALGSKLTVAIKTENPMLQHHKLSRYRYPNKMKECQHG